MSRLSPEQFRETREYRSMTTKQKAFVNHYIVSEDEHEATKHAYVCKDDQVAKKYSYRVMAMPAVIMALAVYYQDNPSEMFAKLLWRKIVSGRLKETELEGMKLYARVKGLGSYANWMPGLEPDIKKAGSVIAHKKLAAARAAKTAEEEPQEQPAKKNLLNEF
jgi:hypothetical protein